MGEVINLKDRDEQKFVAFAEKLLHQIPKDAVKKICDSLKRQVREDQQ